VKVLIIGLDGVTWDVLDDAVLSQHMPQLYHLKQSGTQGVLESTVPAVTPAAWTTCTSGCQPFRHGLVNFHQYAFSDNSYYYTHSGVVKVPGLWHYLGDQGYHVASINVPMTFPVYPVNGFMISGLGCPGPKSEFVHPAWFKEVLLRAIPDYAPGLGIANLPESRHRFRDT